MASRNGRGGAHRGRLALLIVLVVAFVLVAWAALGSLGEGDGVDGDVSRAAAAEHLALTREAQPDPTAEPVSLVPVALGDEAVPLSGCAGVPEDLGP